MRLGILGPLEVVGDDGARREPAAPRQRRLLLALVVSPEEPVSADRLVDRVWGDEPLPRDPLGALRTYVTRLRTVLEPEEVGRRPRVLVGGPDHYVLRLDRYALDARSFEADLAAAVDVLDAEPDAALCHLDRALARWRGPALIDVADEHWAMPEAVRLDELRVVAQEHRLACLLRADRSAEAVGELERLVREHPLRERPHALLMTALAGSGRAPDAADVFRTFRERLADETGLDPSGELHRVHQQILDAGEALDDAPISGVWNGLPATRTPLIGRQAQLDAVSEMVVAHPLVTLTGVGGVGKTRLAIEVARKARDAGTRVLFADLGRIALDADVVGAVLAALRLPALARADDIEALLRLLAIGRRLVVIDNCEHLLDAVAGLVDRLTRHCPDLTLLITSREPIGVAGERVHRLASLDTPAAVALFLESAAAAGAALPAEPSALRHVEEICHRLDGIPLAIELAAARSAHMAVAEIARRLDDRFWLLAGGRRSLPRQQTLRATLDWSYDLLTAEERRVLRAAAVFVGGFDVDALAAVIDRPERSTIEVLVSLVTKSLVEARAGTEHARYRLLETVRLYGLDRLAEADEAAAARHAHAEHLLQRAMRHPPRLRDLPAGVEGSMCRIRLEPAPDPGDDDLANDLAALVWLDRQGDLDAVGRLAARMATVVAPRGFLDRERRYLGRDDVVHALDDPAERALYLVASALHATYFGEFAEERRWARAAMDTAPDPETRAVACALAVQGSLASEPAAVSALVDEALHELPADARFARLLVRGQESLVPVLYGAMEDAVARLEEHARGGDAFAASELKLVLHLLGDDERAVAVPVPEGAQPRHAVLWSYRWPLAAALAAAADGRDADAALGLLDAAEAIASVPVALLDHDVLLACAARAYHRGEHDRCARLLTPGGRNVRSPASYRLHRHYDRLVTSVLGAAERDVVAHDVRDVQVADALAAELDELAHAAASSGSSSLPPGRT